MFRVIFSIFVFFILRVRTQVPSFGECPDVQVVQDFKVDEYLGKWYEIEKYFAIFELGGKCISAVYGKHPNDTDAITVVNKQINQIFGTSSQVEGYAKFEDPSSTEAKLTVTFTSLPVSNSGKYWVLGTDYENYAVVWSCSSAAYLNGQFAWILARERKPSEEILEKAYAVIEQNNLSKFYLMKTNQDDCPEEQ
ncbi:apolipoprotein D-like [Ctenocephalides felis]|uniref:apolipoprotein D-like n=1 Tax=Ctenocephalides felis TaxID=7515 RepID=UPI000E6E2EE8|nr:apolipoprotein D-like [Ctenocephalides felis]